MRISRPRPVKSDKPLPEFIAWDGEGINLHGEGQPQSYVLFGSSVGHIENIDGLSTFDCLDHIIDTGKAHPGAVHCGFSFGYDSNMIMSFLSRSALARLHKNGYVRLRRSDGSRYTVTFAKQKFLRVSKLRPEYDPKTNPTAKTTVTIFDVFSFFATSFIKAYEKMLGKVPEEIRTGKAARGQWKVEDYPEILKYWSIEIQLLRLMAEELRKRIYAAGIRITEWYGPGALATHMLKRHHIKDHMRENSPEIRQAARYAYMAGRFERFRLGRFQGQIYGADIHSAYPEAIAQLPSMSEGRWEYVKNPTRLVRFGVYHVQLCKFSGFVTTPSPLFHRDRNHNITFPWRTDGWYWTPEALHAQRAGADIIEGWEYRGAKTLPFAWIPDIYEQRKQWKGEGNSAELALKLLMNSIYGKLAQRIGWDPIRQKMPPFHQLEWAGWVTSYTRAKLYDVIGRIPFDKLIAVETDGLYTTMNPAHLGMVDSDILGGWEIKQYQEMMYVQSGLAWLLDENGKWTDKRRGLDPCRDDHRPEECDCASVFSLNACRDFLSQLHADPRPGNMWPKYSGQTTRFVGMGQALVSKRVGHCVWETRDRDIMPGMTGKRIHFPPACDACDRGKTAYEMAHDMVISTRATREPYSYPHDVPWEQTEGNVQWREYQDDFDDYIEVG